MSNLEQNGLLEENPWEKRQVRKQEEQSLGIRAQRQRGN